MHLAPLAVSLWLVLGSCRCATSGKLQKCIDLLEEMRQNGISTSTVNYARIVSSVSALAFANYFVPDTAWRCLLALCIAAISTNRCW